MERTPHLPVGSAWDSGSGVVPFEPANCSRNWSNRPTNGPTQQKAWWNKLKIGNFANVRMHKTAFTRERSWCRSMKIKGPGLFSQQGSKQGKIRQPSLAMPLRDICQSLSFLNKKNGTGVIHSKAPIFIRMNVQCHQIRPIRQQHAARVTLGDGGSGQLLQAARILHGQASA